MLARDAQAARRASTKGERRRRKGARGHANRRGRGAAGADADGQAGRDARQPDAKGEQGAGRGGGGGGGADPDVAKLLVALVHLLDAVLQRRLRPEHCRVPLPARTPASAAPNPAQPARGIGDKISGPGFASELALRVPVNAGRRRTCMVFCIRSRHSAVLIAPLA